MKPGEKLPGDERSDGGGTVKGNRSSVVSRSEAKVAVRLHERVSGTDGYV